MCKCIVPELVLPVFFSLLCVSIRALTRQLGGKKINIQILALRFHLQPGLRSSVRRGEQKGGAQGD